MTKKFNLLWLAWNIFEFVVIAVAAAFCYSYSAGGKDDWKGITIACIIGAVISLSGALRLGVSVYTNKKVDAGMLLLRALEVSAGIALITIGYKISFNLLAWSIAIFLVVLGVLLAAIAIYKMVRNKKANFKGVMETILATLFLAFGIVSIVVCVKVYYQEAFDNGVEIVLGALGTIAGIYAIVKLIISSFIFYKADKTGVSVMDIVNAPVVQKTETAEEEPVEAMVDDTEDESKEEKK